jgi:hypothetical protein
MSVYDFLYLPGPLRIAYWNSLGRALDPIQNWTDLWSVQMAAHEQDPTGLDWKDIETQAIRLILEDNGWPLPELISLHDDRAAMFQYSCNDVGLSETDHMLELFNRVFGVDVWLPNIYETGTVAPIFHSFFNNCPREEITNTEPDTTCYRKIHLVKVGDNTFFGLKSETEELISWTYDIPALANLSSFTVRAMMRFKNINLLTFGPNSGGDPITQNGFWGISKAGDNKIYWSVNDGTSLKTIVSDAAHNNEIIEIFCIIDGTDIKMYIDGVLQADIGTLDAVPDWYSAGSIYIGDNAGGNDFKGTMFELAIDGEVITP